MSQGLRVISVSCSGTAQALLKFPSAFCISRIANIAPAQAQPQGRVGLEKEPRGVKFISNPSVLPKISRWNFLFWYITETQTCCLNFKSGPGFDLVFKIIFPTAAHPFLRAHGRNPAWRQEYKQCQNIGKPLKPPGIRDEMKIQKQR